jgi:cytoskeletal protein CcmA (bactofilin family)
MKCLDPIAASTFADGEATGAEARAAAAHIAVCARCRELVNVLRRENVLLQESLRDLEPLPEKSLFRVGTGWALFGVVGGSLGLQLLIEQLSAAAPTGLEWLHPAEGAPWWQVLFGAGFYLFENGSEVAQMITSIGVVGLIGALLVWGSWFVRRRGLVKPVMLVAMMAMLFAGQGNAIEHRKARVVVVAASETVNDTLIATGDSVHIDGTIEGDLILMCRQATIRGTVRGNVVSFSRNLDVEGKVEGSTYTFAQIANLRGEMTRNVFSFSQNLSMPSSSKVGGNLAAFAQEIDLQAHIGRDAATFSEAATVRGNVGRNLLMHGRRINVAAPAHIGGDLRARVESAKGFEVGDGVTIVGQRDVQVKPRPSRYATAGFYYWLAIKFIGAWLVGMVLFWLTPVLVAGKIDSSAPVFGQLGRGFLIFVATPVAACIAIIFLIGLPLGLIALVLWLIAIYMAKIVVAAALGRVLLPDRAGTGGFALALAAGLAVVLIGSNLPYVGGLVWLLVALLGLGMAFDALRARARQTPAPAV